MTNLDIQSAYLGLDPVDAIYLGTDVVWQPASSGGGDVVYIDDSGVTHTDRYPNGIIPDAAYQDRYDIVSVNIGSGITRIGNTDGSYVFAGCDNLSAVTIGPDVEYIGGRAFEGIYNLKNVTIPASVTEIDTNAFYNFDSSCTIVFEGDLPSMSMVQDGDLGFGTNIIVPDEYLSNYCSYLDSFDLNVVSDQGNNCSGPVPPTDYSTEPLTLKAVGSDPASITVNSQYSGGTVYYRESGGEWHALSPGQRLDLFVGTPVQLMGFSGATGLFSGSTPAGAFEVYGNVMSLIYGENFTGQTTIPSSLVDCFYSTFRNCEHLVSIKNLVMPATTLSSGCYRSMFNKCGYLTELPDVFIPSGAILTSACCRYTFEQMAASASTSVEVPFGFLPTTNMAVRCYESMFNKANISSAPELPATTLAERCYGQMFQGCTNLTTAPILLTETVNTNWRDCYNSMFSGCTSLSAITCLLICSPPSSYSIYTGIWLSNVAATGTFYKHPNATWNNGPSGIPFGWTVQDYVEPNN